MTDSIVPVYVAFDGNWEMEDRNWVYKDAKSQVILVEKNVTYEQLKAILYGELQLDSSVYEIKLSSMVLAILKQNLAEHFEMANRFLIVLNSRLSHFTYP